MERMRMGRRCYYDGLEGGITMEGCGIIASSPGPIFYIKLQWWAIGPAHMH